MHLGKECTKQEVLYEYRNAKQWWQIELQSQSYCQKFARVDQEVEGKTTMKM